MSIHSTAICFELSNSWIKLIFGKYFFNLSRKLNCFPATLSFTVPCSGYSFDPSCVFYFSWPAHSGFGVGVFSFFYHQNFFCDNLTIFYCFFRYYRYKVNAFIGVYSFIDIAGFLGSVRTFKLSMFFFMTLLTLNVLYSFVGRDRVGHVLWSGF
ncbi:hypothetical protein AX774_g1693 [Zancudomyces culisetae]|uniref:Uncharacterized protein n=1 Tax=Zancudomyces culisetae TaxID=1213189 RepID=A0A1R1PV55_ZANCU|nr:hypothetical protein AX774_g1693 [Zancudomyces culisetae]|eukprot:OMH84772.1 hypothetical protein AX774_g1693 [Zancudomyces culisetae]